MRVLERASYIFGSTRLVEEMKFQFGALEFGGTAAEQYRVMMENM